jgi:hypothetical protein
VIFSEGETAAFPILGSSISFTICLEKLPPARPPIFRGENLGVKIADALVVRERMIL